MRKSHRPQRIVAGDVTRPSAAICQIPSLPFNAKLCATDRSERKPHQRTVNETLRISLALSGHGENV